MTNLKNLLIAISAQIFSMDMDNDQSQEFKDTCKKNASTIIRFYETETLESLKKAYDSQASFEDCKHLLKVTTNLMQKYNYSPSRVDGLNNIVDIGLNLRSSFKKADTRNK